jgi:hypothetical protein
MPRLWRRRRPDELAAIEADIIRFGEALAAHSLVPSTHRGNDGLLADYERALDAYELAKRAFVDDRNARDAEDVMRALEDGWHALARVDARLAGRPLPVRLPSARPPEQTAPSWQGSKGPHPFAAPPAERPHVQRKGDARVKLAKIAPQRPAILVVNTSGRLSILALTHRGGSSTVSLPRSGPVIHPLPPSSEEALALEVGANSDWAAWLLAPEDLPTLDVRMPGTGMYLFRHEGERVPVRVRQRGRGAFVLLRYSSSCELDTAVLVADGKFSTETDIPGQGLYLVKPSAAWSIDRTR